MLGIYLMNERNTPGVGAVLSRYGLAEIPEVHCYLLHGDGRIDVTRAIDSRAEPIAALLHEEEIAPPQVGTYKVACIRSSHETGSMLGIFPHSWTFDEIWRVREECIAALEK
jgi:hypothetical protein